MNTDTYVYVIVGIFVAVAVIAILRAAWKFGRGVQAGYRGSRVPQASPSSRREHEHPGGGEAAEPQGPTHESSGAPRADQGEALTTGGRRTTPTKIFVSYRRDDNPYVAGRVYDSLIKQFGASAVFKDIDSVPLGVDFRKAIDQAVSTATVVLVIIGRAWLGPASGPQRRIDSPRDFVRIELAAALRRGIPVVPLLVDGAPMPDADTLPEELRDFAYRNAVPIRPDPDFENDMERLIRGITILQDSTT